MVSVDTESEHTWKKFFEAMKRLEAEWKKKQHKSPLTKRILQRQRDRDSNWPGKRRRGE